jgi:hypothetical protein
VSSNPVQVNVAYICLKFSYSSSALKTDINRRELSVLVALLFLFFLQISFMSFHFIYYFIFMILFLLFCIAKLLYTEINIHCGDLNWHPHLIPYLYDYD